MGGDNMESLLLQGDDSSSGESDSEVAVGGGSQRATAAAAVAPVVAAPNPPMQQPAPVAPASQPPNPSQSEIAARLKSMYSPATKNNPQTKQAQPPVSQVQAPQASAQPPLQPPQQQALNKNPAPLSQQYHRNSSAGSAHSGGQPPQIATAPQAQVHHRTLASSGGIPNQQQQAPTRRPPIQKPVQHQMPPSFTLRGGVPQPSGSGLPQVGSGNGGPAQYEPAPAMTNLERSNVVRQQQPMPNPPVASQVPIGDSSTSSSHRSASGYHMGATPTGSAPMPAPQVSGGLRVPGAPSGMSRTDKEREMKEREIKKYKERFLFFTRVLMKYLEQKDPALHQNVKEIIKDCADRNRRQEKGYESVTTSMRTRLKAFVPDGYWKRAEAHVDQLLKAKAKSDSAKAMAAAAAGTSSGIAGIPLGASSGASMDEMRRRQEMEQRLRAQQAAQRTSQLPPSSSSVPQDPVPALSSGQPDAMKNRPVPNRSTHGVPVSADRGPPPAVSAATAPSATSATPANPFPEGKNGGKGRNSKAPSAASKRKPSIGTTPPVGKQQQATTISETPKSQSLLPPPAESTPTLLSPPRSVKPPPPPVREYNDIMELVDHAVHYDWTVAGLLMDKEQPDVLSTEQKALFEEAGKSMSTSMTSYQHHNRDAFPIPGWGIRNILSARSAWALLRLPEDALSHSRSNTPMLGAKGLLDSSASSNQLDVSLPVKHDHAWYNEQAAEDDKVLAILSEGLQIYIKGVMEKAVHCARQRHNIDGIRLWHQQTSLAMKAKAVMKENKTGNKDNVGMNELPNPPPLTLRVGCDVTRQVAQASGNASMTVKRMEEALERLPAGSNRGLFTAETETSCLLQVSSMSELALLPKLAKAVDDADLTGKRCFEVYGGKHSSEPPLGRVPKQPKVEVVDFQMGMNFVRRDNRRSRAGTNSSSFFY